MHKARVLEVFLFALLGLLVATSSWAQGGNQGSVEGTVADPSGALIPGATVTAKNVDTGTSFIVETESNGLFRFPVLPVGTYELTVEKAGFGKLTQKDVVVTVGAKVNLNLAMSLAAQGATVLVAEQTPVVETTRTQVSATVTERSVADLPVNGRNFIEFVLLTPGVTRDVRTGDISFAGQRGTLNSLTVDGTDNNNSFFGQTLGRTGSGRAPYQFSQDAVKEFQVNSNAYAAELGRAGGALINVVTKSGTNGFHGTAFWFYRDRSLNANDLINKNTGRPKSPFHFNQFGGNIGGPIVKNKAFFFFDYDGQRNTLPNLVFLNLPAGFTLSTDPTIAAFQQQALDYLTSRADSWVRTQDQNVYLVKGDWNISEKHLLAVRWNNQRFTGGGFESGGPQNSFEHTGASLVQTDTLTGSLTSTLGPSLVNVARVAFVRDREPGEANSVNPEASIFEGGQQVLTIGRNFFSPRNTTINRGQWADTLTWVRGRHTPKFGADFIVDRILNFFPGNFSGSYRFNSLESFGRNLAGTPSPISGERFVQAFAGTGTPGPTTLPNIFEFSWFVQDEWRVRPNLTLNLGLRYDLQKVEQPPIDNPAASLAAAGISTSLIRTDKNNFGPRFGFAWTPYSNNRLVVRGGYGLFYGRTPSIMVGTAHSNNGLSVQTRTFTGSDIPIYPNTICGAPDSSGASPSCPAPSTGSSSNPIIFVFSRDYAQPYVQQGSLGVELGFRRDFSFSTSYLVVKGTHLQRTRDVNLATPQTPTTIGIANTTDTVTFPRFTLPRPVAGFDRIATFEGNANSIYHGVTFQLAKRFSHNYQVLASYTIGKVIDDKPDATSVVPFTFDDAKQIQNPADIRDDRGPGENDQHQRFVFSGVWDLNYANSLPSVAKAIFGGWELSWIFTAQAGQPYSGAVSFDLNNDGNNRTDRNPSLGRNTFYLPRTVSLDPRVTRNVRLLEQVKLQFIFESFNIFNRANISSVQTTQFARSTSSSACGIAGTPCLVPQTNFGAPLGTSGPRIIQLAAKITF